VATQNGCIFGWLSKLFGSSKAPADGPAMPRVMVNKYFVSDAEADFFRVLRAVVGDRGHVLAQVSMGRLLWFRPGQDRGLTLRWRNKTGHRTIDFLVCDPATLRPLVAIELDEPSHATPERQTRDQEVEDILNMAGLPLVHVLTSRTYDTRELEEWLAPHLAGK
jgi:hypothetical protein